MKIEIAATSRERQGTGASRRLRHAGRVPGILYGDGKDAQPIEFDHNELYHKLKLEAFHASVLTVQLDGKPQPALLRDVQLHPFRQLVLHVDFQRVALDKKIHMKVPLHFINAEISPGVKTSGGIISHVANEVEVSCLPADLPEFIEVDLANLSAGHSFHVSALKAPPSIEFVALQKGGDPAIATVILPRAAKVEEEAAPAADAAPAAAKAPAKAAPAAKAAAPAAAKAPAAPAKKK